MMPPHVQLHKRSVIYSLIAAAALILASIIIARGQLVVIDFSNGLPGGTNGLALEDTLRNSQRAILANIIASHNGSWLQRSNAFYRDGQIYQQQLLQTFWAEETGAYIASMYTTMINTTNFLNAIRTNTLNSVYELETIRGYAYTNFLQNEIRQVQLEQVVDSIDQVQEYTFRTVERLTNVIQIATASTNIQTGISNLNSYANGMLMSLSNLLSGVTNREQIQISFDGAMSNSLYSINNAASWFQYIATNTKEATNFLAMITVQTRDAKNILVAATNTWMGISNLNSTAQFHRIAQTNILAGISNLVGLTYTELLTQTALMRETTNGQAQMVAHLSAMRSNQYSVTVTNQLQSISNSLVVVSNTAAATMSAYDQLRQQYPGDIYDVTGTNWTMNKMLSNQMARGAATLSLKQAEMSNAFNKMGGITIAEPEATGKPEGFLSMTAGGRTFNFDARDHAQWATPISRMRDFIGWVITAALFVAVWQEARTAAFVTQLSPQMKVPDVEILGNNFGPLSYILWLPLLCAAIITVPVGLVNVVSSNSFFTTFLDFSNPSNGVITNPFDGLATAVQGIYYFVDTYVPVPTLVAAGVSYMGATAQISAITAVGGLAIRAVFS